MKEQEELISKEQKSPAQFDIRTILQEDVNINELVVSMEIWFNTLAAEERIKHSEFGRMLQRISDGRSYDFASLQALLSYIFEMECIWQ